MLNSFKQKQLELDTVRVQAADEARRLSVDLGKAQSEANVLIMELKKYEGLASFLTLEKDLILRAMEDQKGIDPALAARGVEQTEQRRQELQREITKLSQTYTQVLEQVRQDSHRHLNEDEVQELKHRLTQLTSELTFKQSELQRVQQQTRYLQETAERALNPEQDMNAQAREIEHLNKEYADGLGRKVQKYEELSRSVRMLAQRNDQYMRNEVELARIEALGRI
jgi:chromosome segregation ATPase